MTPTSYQKVATNLSWKLEPKDLPVLRRLARGLSSFIYETTWQGKRCSRKDFPIGLIIGNSIFESEAKCLFDLDHPNIVKCFGYTIGKSTCSLLQEYVDDNLQSIRQKRIDLQRKEVSSSSLPSRVLSIDVIKELLSSPSKEKEIDVDEFQGSLGVGSTIPFNLSEAFDIISQIAIGMKYLHDNAIVHGDLKPKNVLVHQGLHGRFKIQINDFGLIGTKKYSRLDSKRRHYLDILMWKAPELLDELLGPSTKYSNNPLFDLDIDEDDIEDEFKESRSSSALEKGKLSMADVYSFGLLCLYVIGGELVHPNLRLKQFQNKELNAFRPTLPLACPKLLNSLIYRCLEFEPLKRPTFSTIVANFMTPTLKAYLLDFSNSLEETKNAPIAIGSRMESTTFHGDQVESEDAEEDRHSLGPIIPPGPQNTLLDQLTPRRAQAAADLNNSPVNGWIGGDLRSGNVSSSAWLSSSDGGAGSSLENLLDAPTGLTPRTGLPFPPLKQPTSNSQFPDMFGLDAFTNGPRQDNFSSSNDVAGWCHMMERNSSQGGDPFALQSNNFNNSSNTNSGPVMSRSAAAPYVKQESMNGATIWAETLEQVTSPSTHRNIMESLMSNSTSNQTMEMSDSPRTQDHGPPQLPPSKGILEALSPRGLGREPQTALEASLQAVTQKEALKTAGLYQKRLQLGMRSDSQPLDLQFEKKVPLEKSPEIEAFSKLDSFGRWMTYAMDGQSVLSPGALQSSWPGTPTMSFPGLADDLYQTMQVDTSLSTSVSSDQRYSITDTSPEWAYASEGAKVLISGVFLGDYANATDVKWHCMFGEVEVPAEVISGGVLRCKAPPHAAGRVSFYVTCGDRQAHSEIREFEYCSGSKIQFDPKAEVLAADERLLRVRIAHMLLTDSDSETPIQFSDEDTATKQANCLNSFSPSLGSDDWLDLEKEATSYLEYSRASSFQDRLLQTMLKTRMQRWLLWKIQEEGKGASVLDAQGQGVFHMAAALGYDWVVAPMVAAGVPINFRDTHGWTALHWAASFGKEQVVIALVQHGADPSTVTDSTPSCPSGQTPADLALTKGHVGIGGFLAETSWTRRISTMSLSDNSFAVANAQVAADNAVARLSRRDSIKQTLNRADDQVSIRDSLQAARNAARAAALIQATFRQHSFRKMEEDLDLENFDEYGMTESQMRGFVAARAAQRTQKFCRGHNEKKQQLAASRIQQKFRSWKVRKDFVNLRGSEW